MTDDLVTERKDLLFGVRRSVRYHRRRQQFLDRVGDVAKVLTAITGSATFATVYTGIASENQWLWLPLTASALTAVFAAVDVVVSPGRGARHHDELAREFIALEQAILQKTEELTPQALVAMQTRRLDIEATEPPHYRVLNMMCHNELVRALGESTDEYVDLSWLQQRLANFVDLRPERPDKRTRTA